MALPAAAQPAGPPPQDEPIWELATWLGTDPLGNPQTQASSGEDWFYSIAQSRTAAGVIDGYVTAGYSTFPSTGMGVSPGCEVPCDDENGCTYPTLTKTTPGGEVEWTVTAGLTGVFWKVIGTSDGGYLAVGHTNDRSLVGYNPTAADTTGRPLVCWPNDAPRPQRRRSVMFAAKFDHDGVEQWRYAYGQMDNPNDHVYQIGALQTQERQDIAWDVVERPDGGFRIVACAVDPDIGMNPRAFAVDIDADGFVQDRQVYGQGGIPSNPSTWRRSMLMAIERWGDEYVAVGTQFNDTLEVGFGDVFVVRLDTALAVQAQATLTNTPYEQDTGFNVAFAGDGSVHVASVLDCQNFGSCRREGAGGEGDLVVHRLRRSDLAVLGSTGSTLGQVKGFDILVGLTPTPDGGTALVTTKQPGGPTGQGSDADNTDAFVAKLSATAAVEWTTLYDARTSRLHTEEGDDPPSTSSIYEKHQECLYDIVEDGEGGLVIAGNNSSNLDDGYVVRFGTSTAKSLPATTVANSHLVYPTAHLNNNQHYIATLAGDLEVAASGEVWVDPERTLKFATGSRLRVDGLLQMEGARLTEATTGQGWDGVAVVGAFEAEIGTVIEKADIGVTVYDPGTASLSGVTLQGNTVGLDVLSDEGTTIANVLVTQNGTGIRSGVPETIDGIVFCFSTCRSAFVLRDSNVSANTWNGVYAISADAEIEETVMSGNGASGLRVSDATVNPFNNNILESNGEVIGIGTAEDGIWVLAGGDLQMKSEGQQPYGVNRVAENGGRELVIAAGGTAFIGSLGAFDDDGRNSIFDDSGVFIANNSGATIYAGNTYWDYVGGPPPGAITNSAGSLVKTGVASDCDWTVSPPACLTQSRGATVVDAEALSEAPDSPTSGEARGEQQALREAIRAARAALVADPASGQAPALVRTLAALHRRDRSDATGEAATSWERLSALRARLSTADLPPALRPTAEAALEVEAVEHLTRGEREAARELLELASVTEGSGVRRVLSLVEAHLEAAEGRYTEAAALVTAVAAEEAVEGDPESGLDRVLLDLAAVYAERAGGEPAARGSGPEALARTGDDAQPESATASLAAYPNPASTAATIALTLPADADASVLVYDVLGRRVATLAEGALEGGVHRLALDAARLPSGVYLVRATTDGTVLTRRLTLVR